MKQEHKNSKLDKALKEKFEHAEVSPPSFQKLMFGMEEELENAWQQNFQGQPRGWESITIYSLVLTFLLPLWLLTSDSFTVNSPQIVEQQTEKIEGRLKANDLAHANQEEKLDKASVQVKITDKKNIRAQKIVAIKDNLPSGKVIPEKNHNSFSSSLPPKTTSTIPLTSSFQTQSIALLPVKASVIQQETNEAIIPVLLAPQEEEGMVAEYNEVILPTQTKGEFYIGALGSVYSPWILNQNTYGAFNGYEFAYAFNSEQKLAFRAGYNTYGKLGVEVGFVFNAHQGQHYEDHILGKFQTREVSLDYWQIPVLAKYRAQLKQGRQIPAIFNIEFGFAYNHLKSAQEIVNHGAGKDISNRFKPNILQGILGMSTDFYLSERVFATVGLRSLISNDINARGWEVSDGYRKSHSIIVGANLGISYRFAK